MPSASPLRAGPGPNLLSAESPMQRLVQDICQENDYMLEFQTTTECQRLVCELIKVRDGTSRDVCGVYLALNQVIDAHKPSEDPSVREFDDEVLRGLLSAKQRIETAGFPHVDHGGRLSAKWRSMAQLEDHNRAVWFHALDFCVVRGVSARPWSDQDWNTATASWSWQWIRQPKGAWAGSARTFRLHCGILAARRQLFPWTNLPRDVEYELEGLCQLVRYATRRSVIPSVVWAKILMFWI